jgi:hypothetical protein
LTASITCIVLSPLLVDVRPFLTVFLRKRSRGSIVSGPTSLPQQFPTELLVLYQEFRDDHPQRAILPG